MNEKLFIDVEVNHTFIPYQYVNAHVKVLGYLLYFALMMLSVHVESLMQHYQSCRNSPFMEK